MAINIVGAFIDLNPELIPYQGIQLEDKERLFLPNLCPKELSIGFHKSSTILLMEELYYKNLSETSILTPLEQDLVNLFPKQNIFIAVQNETINFYGFSLITNSIKERTKAVVNGDLFLDYGRFNYLEQKLFDGFKSQIEASNVHKNMLEKEFINLRGLEKDKAYMRVHDRLKSKSKLKYLDGTLDSLIIESYIKAIVGLDVLGIENIVEFTQFKKREINFDTESLIPYIEAAKYTTGSNREDP